MNFTDSPYEAEMKKVPFVVLPLSEKQLFRKELIYSESCKQCLYGKKRKEKCKWIECPYLKERIESKEISLLEMIAPIIYLTQDKIFVRRMMKLYKEIKGGAVSDMFRNEIHRKNFETVIAKYEKQGAVLTNRFFAALFLVTADSFLWRQTKEFVRPNVIDLSEVDIRGIDTDGYLLYKAAKDMMFKTSKVTASELADKMITNEKCFKAIMNAIIIARYGKDTIKLDTSPRVVSKEMVDVFE